LGVASTIVKNFASRAGSTGSVGSETAGTTESAVLAGSVDGVGTNWAGSKALEVEE
jgi:hypothetical protein